MTSASEIVSTTFKTMADPAENNGRTPQSDLIVGIAMIIVSVNCAVAYSVILVAIWRDNELIRMTSYKFMFVLGWCDVIQCFPHAVTGIFTIYQSTGTYWIAKLMGVLASPFYNGYAVLTVMLSINRFVQLALPQLDQTFFSPRATMVWIGVAVGIITIYFVGLLTPWAALIYDPKWYGWRWDFTLPASIYLQKMAMSIQVGGFILSGVFYIGVVIMLLRTRKRFAASRNYHTEVKILIQAGTITVYCSILNILWHNYKLILPDTLWTSCALNLMWILNSAVYPIIYFIVNSALREKIVRATKETRKKFSNSFAKADSSKKMTSAPPVANTTFNVMADPAENNGRTPQSDLIIGIAMIILSVLCAVSYSVILVAIWRDKELIRMTSYKFMFVLGWCDVIQCFPHAVTGIFTIYQSTGTYWIAKLMGVCATPFYNGYAVLTVMLSINRFVQLAFPQLDQTLFSPRATMVWIGVAGFVMTIYFVALLTPWAAMMYDPKWYGWGWDFTLPASFYLQKMAMSIQVGGIILSGFFYIGVVIMLLRTRKRFAASRNYNTEVKILIQAGTITVYCSILNILWHNYKLILPDDLWTYCALNFMWILNSGVYPIIYFIVNSALRGKIVRASKETRKKFSNSIAKADSSKVNGTSITRIV